MLVEFNFFQDIFSIKCSGHEKLKDIIAKYLKEKLSEENDLINNFFFLCHGQKVDDLEKSVYEFADNFQKQSRKISLLVVESDEEQTPNTQIQSYQNTQNENTTIKNMNSDNIKTNALIYTNPNRRLIINFNFEGMYHPIKCNKAASLQNVCLKFADIKKRKKDYFKFLYCNNLINQNQTVGEFFQANNIEGEGITIMVEDNRPCYVKYKIAIAGIVSIIIGGIITTIIVVTQNNKDKNKSSSKISLKLSNNINYKDKYFFKNNLDIKDYFIKATYFSEINEKVRLISDKYNINKIKKMYIDGKIITPNNFYTFKKKGNHIILYSFNKFNNNSLLKINEGNGIFSGVVNLLKAEFSEYEKDYPDVRFYRMFDGCINLRFVDFSNIKLKYSNNNNIFFMEYFTKMDYMFNNCKNLIELKFSKYLPITNSKYMFNNCSSLKLINLSQTTIQCYNKLELNNMFSNCISLKSIKLPNINCHNKNINMSYMLYNCSSLNNLNFNSNNMTQPQDMSYSFAYCISLKKFDLYFKNIKNLVSSSSMKGAFKNCSLLTSIKLRFEIAYNDMSYLFMGCVSLKIIESYLEKGVVKYINYMFYDCKSLKTFPNSFNLPSNNLTDMSYMFNGCDMLNKVDLSLLNTKDVINYEGLFYNCKNLMSVNISSFTHNNLPRSNLSIFDDNYSSKIKITMNEEFLKKIKKPSNSIIDLYNY